MAWRVGAVKSPQFPRNGTVPPRKGACKKTGGDDLKSSPVFFWGEKMVEKPPSK